MMLSASAKSHARSLRVGLALIGVAGAALAIDASTKSASGASLDPGERSQILPGLAMVHAENSGAAFGLLAGGGTWLLPAISALAIVAGIPPAAARLDPRRPGNGGRGRQPGRSFR